MKDPKRFFKKKSWLFQILIVMHRIRLWLGLSCNNCDLRWSKTNLEIHNFCLALLSFECYSDIQFKKNENND
jgi:hypothetical protein